MNRSGMREIYVEMLRIADAFSCGMTTAPFRTKHSNDGLGRSWRMFNKSNVVGPYYGTIVYHHLWSRQLMRKVYGAGVLKTIAG